MSHHSTRSDTVVVFVQVKSMTLARTRIVVQCPEGVLIKLGFEEADGAHRVGSAVAVSKEVFVMGLQDSPLNYFNRPMFVTEVLGAQTDGQNSSIVVGLARPTRPGGREGGVTEETIPELKTRRTFWSHRRPQSDVGGTGPATPKTVRLSPQVNTYTQWSPGNASA